MSHKPMPAPGSIQIALALVLVLCAACERAGPPAVTNARSAEGLAYDVEGEGPWVVLVHGSNLDRRMWDETVARLRSSARVLRYDMRGQGASDDPEEPFSNPADLLALMDEAGAGEATLVGLSAGAQVVLDVALEAPQRVRGMVLASPSLLGYVPDTIPDFFGDLAAALKAGDHARANEVLLASPVMAVPPRYRDRVRTMVVDNSRLWTLPYELVEFPSPPAIQRLESIRVPALVLVGQDDLDAIQAQALLLEQRLPKARRVVIAGGGHLLNMTSPDGFQLALESFLKSSRN